MQPVGPVSLPGQDPGAVIRPGSSRRSVVNRQILRLAVPALGALAADPLVSLVDTAFVSRLGEVELARSGVNAAIFSVAFALFNFLAYGTTPLVAKAIGRGEPSAADRTITTALVVAAALGAAAVLVLELGGRWFLELMQSPAEAVDSALAYLRIRAWAAPAVLVILVGHGAFRGFQDTRTPLIVTVWLNVLNLVLDPVLIFGFGLGMQGAAIATVAAQWLGAVWFLRLLAKHWLGVRSVDRAELRGFLRIGRQLTIRTISLLGALTLATAMAARAGTRVLAAHQVVGQVWFLSALVLDALAIAGQALVGRFLGEGDAKQVDRVVRALIGWGFIAGLAMAGLMLAVRPWLGAWFGTGAEVSASISSAMVLVAALQPLGAVLFVGDGVYSEPDGFGLLTWSTVVGRECCTSASSCSGSRRRWRESGPGSPCSSSFGSPPRPLDYLRRGSVLAT